MTNTEIAAAKARVARREEVRREANERAKHVSEVDRQIIEGQFEAARNQAYHIRNRGRTLYA